MKVYSMIYSNNSGSYEGIIALRDTATLEEASRMILEGCYPVIKTLSETQIALAQAMQKGVGQSLIVEGFECRSLVIMEK